MDLKIFTNEKFGKVRTLVDTDKVLFCANDVAVALGYKKPNNAIHRHCRHATLFQGIITDNLGRKQDANFIPEGDIYRLVVGSELPDAVEFEEWIFDNVIPSIRKYGMYATMDTIDKMLADPNNAIKIFTALKEEREAKEKALKLVHEKQEEIDLLSHSKKLYTTSEIAKELGFKSPQELNKKLCDLNIQYKVNNSWLLYSKYSDKGYISIKQEIIRHGSKCSPVVYNSKWTQKGREFILKLLTN